jgi:hypothetical protein
MDDEKLICVHWSRCPHFECPHHWPHYGGSDCISDRTCAFTDSHAGGHPDRSRAYCDWPSLEEEERTGDPT